MRPGLGGGVLQLVREGNKGFCGVEISLTCGVIGGFESVDAAHDGEAVPPLQSDRLQGGGFEAWIGGDLV